MSRSSSTRLRRGLGCGPGLYYYWWPLNIFRGVAVAGTARLIMLVVDNVDVLIFTTIVLVVGPSIPVAVPRQATKVAGWTESLRRTG